MEDTLLMKKSLGEERDLEYEEEDEFLDKLFEDDED